MLSSATAGSNAPKYGNNANNANKDHYNGNAFTLLICEPLLIVTYRIWVTNRQTQTHTKHEIETAFELCVFIRLHFTVAILYLCTFLWNATDVDFRMKTGKIMKRKTHINVKGIYRNGRGWKQAYHFMHKWTLSKSLNFTYTEREGERERSSTTQSLRAKQLMNQSSRTDSIPLNRPNT